MRSRSLAIGGFALAVGLAGCFGSGKSNNATTSTTGSTTTANNGAQPSSPGNATGTVENNSPTGDIPDSTVYVPYKPPSGGYQVNVPEGWSRTTTGAAVSFTDKLNTIRLETLTATSAPAASQGQGEQQKLASSVPGFQPGKVSTVIRKAGKVLLITYNGSGPANPVTGKSQVDAFERYEFFNKGKLLVVTLSGPKGADNVDPWLKVTDSVKWTG